MPDLEHAARNALAEARAAENGRYAEILVIDGPLRQTIIALRGGTRLSEHNSPPAASLQLMHGHITVTGENPSAIEAGRLVALTHSRHAVEARDDSVFLLTTVTGLHDAASHGEPPAGGPPS